jgi:excisionase family DNA binding protein
MSIADVEPLLTPQEVATLFRVDPKTVTRWAKAGRLTSIRTLGGHRRYKEAEVRALLTGNSESPSDPLKAPLHTLWPSSVTGSAATVRNRLLDADLTTVGSLADRSADDLRALGLRPPQVDEVRLVLHKKGLALRGEIADKAA